MPDTAVRARPSAQGPSVAPVQSALPAKRCRPCSSSSGKYGFRRILRKTHCRGCESSRFHATCAPLDDFAGKLDGYPAIVIVTASYEGQPPDNARSFVPYVEALGEGALDGVHFRCSGAATNNGHGPTRRFPSESTKRSRRPAPRECTFGAISIPVATSLVNSTVGTRNVESLCNQRRKEISTVQHGDTALKVSFAENTRENC